MIQHNEATLRQIKAANPNAATWLSANAGSGKTRVLTDRVARLLLQGVLPQRILCLTYTKAAASEMQNRLFKRLGSWSMKDDSSLRSELEALGEDTVTAAALARARTLFARAIETPGGLKIQTIHSFCASVLRRFPLEAGVSPQFKEIDERTSEALILDVIDQIADGPDGHVINGLAQHHSSDDLLSLCLEVSKHRKDLLEPVNAWHLFGLEEGYNHDNVLRDFFVENDAVLIEKIADAMLHGSKTDNSGAAAFKQASALDEQALNLLEKAFIYQSGAKDGTPKIDNFPSKGARDYLGPVQDDVNDLMTRVELARERRYSIFAARKNEALYNFARVFLPAFEKRKLELGILDFDDLIQKTEALLSDTAVAQWVLFRLDGGLDHILVDEAQDTSPEQWRVIQLLAEEFTAGEGARAGVHRTIFAVGDPKQSIYSFQGADPAEFARMRDEFNQRFDAIGAQLFATSLDHSFRSSTAILSTVDQVFDLTDAHGLYDKSFHIPFFKDLAGRVDLWPAIDKQDDTLADDWTDTSDVVGQTHHTVQLAQKIAHEIKRQCETGSIPGENGTLRRITPGDFMILVQNRSGVYSHIIAACKAAGVDVAGADRLKLEAEMAVKDLTALLRFLALPDDNLSLACALKSPLFGWSEQQLFSLANNRAHDPLWRELESRSDEFQNTHKILRDLRDAADFLRPYDLIQRVLIRHGGRKNLIARLGQASEDGIDVLLSQALAYERMEIPSLTGFIEWLGTGGIEIKRQLDHTGDQVRVMTVHGAKGLEAPIVILPDTAKHRKNSRHELVRMANGKIAWKTPANQSPKALQSTSDAQRAKDEEENRRLLYVAMTRAEKWLIVCAAGDVGTGEDSWHSMVEAGMRQAGGLATDFPTGQGLRVEHGDWSGDVEEAKKKESSGLEPLSWQETPPIAAPQSPKTLAPTGLGGAKALSDDEMLEADEELSLRRGRLLHRLLEFLPAYPEEEWQAIATDLLATSEDAATPEESVELLREVGPVLRNQTFAWMFSPTALAEVEIVADLPELDGKKMRGTIDRLIVQPERVLAVDFKSNAVVPDSPDQVPLGLLRQMGAYQAGLEQIYPDRSVEVALLWTKTAALMPLERDIVRKALLLTPTS